MTTEEELKSSQPKEMIKHMVECSKMIERFTQIMCKEEENIIAGMFIDQLFKTLLIKNSHTYRIKHEYVAKKL